jgi:hypothetical protein
MACNGDSVDAPEPLCADFAVERRPFFGDTHVHTALSLDANLQGTRLSPSDAYRFAKGEEVGLQPYDAEGRALRTLRLERPLDFVALSDHADFFGTVDLCATPGSPAHEHPGCVMFRDNPSLAFITINGGLANPPETATYPALCGDGSADCVRAGADVWGAVQEAAAAAHDGTDACTFSAFVAYEWSANPAAKNLHRNVIFKDGSVPGRAVGYFDAPRVDELWQALDEECLATAGCEVLTIPHNSNLSSGLMFTSREETSAAMAAQRARLEPLVEVFQHKGDSECWPGSTLSDELCGFEKVPYNTLSGSNLDVSGTPVALDFVRDALAEGLRFQSEQGVNPYRYGLIASSDTHLATPGAVEEAGYPGHGGAGRSNRDELPPGLPDNVTFNPGGLAVLWAEENSRPSLFAAMKRREAYGTSGPRITLRFFGGREALDVDCDDPALVSRGYADGVPMGAELPVGVEAPRFVVTAQADPGTERAPGAALERLQIIKGWLEGDTPRVRVVEVAGDPGATGALDLGTCGAVVGGSARLCGTWTDDDFDPDVPAFYYVRAVEVPTCRWSTLQCVDAGITCPTDDPEWEGCCDDRVEAGVQERAWSSPIWHTPS